MADDVPLRDVFNIQLNALNNKLDNFIGHSKDKFASQNEFRGALSDQARELLPRNEYNVQHTALEDRVDINLNRINSMELLLSSLQASMAARKEGISSIGGIVLGVASVIAVLVSLTAVLIPLLRSAG